MSSVHDVAKAASILGRIEALESERLGKKIEEVRPWLAQSLGSTSETLRNIQRGRKKTIQSWLMGRLDRYWAGLLLHELRLIDHDEAIAQRLGLDVADDARQSARAQKKAALAFLAGADRGGGAGAGAGAEGT
jgi:hypothetical protein